MFKLVDIRKILLEKNVNDDLEYHTNEAKKANAELDSHKNTAEALRKGYVDGNLSHEYSFSKRDEIFKQAKNAHDRLEYHSNKAAEIKRNLSNNKLKEDLYENEYLETAFNKSHDEHLKHMKDADNHYKKYLKAHDDYKNGKLTNEEAHKQMKQHYENWRDSHHNAEFRAGNSLSSLNLMSKHKD